MGQVSFSGCYISGALIDPASTVGCGNSGTNNYCNLASLFVPAFSPTACSTFTTSGGVAHSKATVYSLPAGCTATIQAEFRKRNYLGIGATATGCSNCGMDALPDALSIVQSGGIVSTQGSTLDVNVGTCGTYPTLGTYTTSTASIAGGCSNADGNVSMILTGGTFTVGGASNRADEIITFTINLAGTCGPACGNVLPIELTAFYGMAETNRIKLMWEVAMENNVEFYQVEKSSDAKNWQMHSQQKPVKDENASYRMYTAYDYTPSNGINYYRLMNYDKNGSKGNPHIIAVNFGSENNLYYSEQTETEWILNMNSSSGNNEELVIIDMCGRQVQKIVIVPGTNRVLIRKDQLQRGIYCLVSLSGSLMLKEKLLIH